MGQCTGFFIPAADAQSRTIRVSIWVRCVEDIQQGMLFIRQGQLHQQIQQSGQGILSQLRLGGVCAESL